MARMQRKRWPDGFYHANVTIGRDPETGRPIRKFLKAKTNKALDEKIAAVKAGKYTDDGKKVKPITFIEYAEKWFTLTKSGKSTNTRAQYRNTLDRHCDILRDMPLKNITKSDVLLQLQQSEGHHATQEIMLTCFKQIFNCACDDQIMSYNPAGNIRLNPEPVKKEKRQLTEFEMRCFKQADLTAKERCFVSLLLYTGARRGEILALTKSDINLRKRAISINKAVKHIRDVTEISAPKSKAGYRDIPIFEPLFPVLKEYLKKLDTELLFVSKQSENGKFSPLSKYETQKLWKSIYQKVNSVARKEIRSGNAPDIISLDDPLQGITPHFFRHNLTTILYYSGIDVKDTARILGHSNVNITLETYTHLDEQKRAENVDAVNRYLSGL